MAALEAPGVPLASCTGRSSIASLFTFNGLHRRCLPTCISSLKGPFFAVPISNRRCFNISCRSGSDAVLHSRSYGGLNLVSVEVSPWSKTKGLPPSLAISRGNCLYMIRSFILDMVLNSSYIIILHALGHRVMTVAPRYDQYRDVWATEAWLMYVGITRSDIMFNLIRMLITDSKPVPGTVGLPSKEELEALIHLHEEVAQNRR